jgi:hypothetical protein
VQVVKLPFGELQPARNEVPFWTAVTVTVVLLSLLESDVHVPLIVTSRVPLPVPLAGAVSQRLDPVVAKETAPEDAPTFT